MMLSVCLGRRDLLDDWLQFGGDATLASYGASSPNEIAQSHREHLDFLRSCRLFHETPRHFFVHGNYRADLPLDEQPNDVLLWSSLKDGVPGAHCSGKTAIIGHTAQRSGEILELGYLRCIDTWCYGRGWLTALRRRYRPSVAGRQAGKIEDLIPVAERYRRTGRRAPCGAWSASPTETQWWGSLRSAHPTILVSSATEPNSAVQRVERLAAGLLVVLGFFLFLIFIFVPIVFVPIFIFFVFVV